MVFASADALRCLMSGVQRKDWRLEPREAVLLCSQHFGLFNCHPEEVCNGSLVVPTRTRDFPNLDSTEFLPEENTMELLAFVSSVAAFLAWRESRRLRNCRACQRRVDAGGHAVCGSRSVGRRFRLAREAKVCLDDLVSQRGVGA